MAGTGMDRGATTPGRLRRQLQANAALGNVRYGDGFVYDPNNGTLNLGLALDPALDFTGGLLTVKLATVSGLSKDAAGLTIDLRDTAPGLELVASGLGVLLDPTEPGLQLTGGLKVLLATNGGLALSSGLTIDLRDTAPGLELAASGIGVLLDPTDPGLDLTSGLKVKLDGSSLALGAGGLSVAGYDAAPRWRKYTVGFADLAAAATTNNAQLLSLPAGGVVHAVKIKHSAPFTGGTISAYTLSVGIASSLAKYAPAFDVFQAAGDAVMSVSAIVGSEDHAAAVSIRIAGESTGDNLDQAVAGSADIWVMYSIPGA